MCEEHPVIEELYRSGTAEEKNRKCFARIRVPPHRDASKPPLEYRVTVQGPTTVQTRKQPMANGTPGESAGAVDVESNLPKALGITIVAGNSKYVLLVADESGEWGVDRLHFATTFGPEGTIVSREPALLHLVNPSNAKLRDLHSRVDSINETAAQRRVLNRVLEQNEKRKKELQDELHSDKFKECLVAKSLPSPNTCDSETKQRIEASLAEIETLNTNSTTMVAKAAELIDYQASLTFTLNEKDLMAREPVLRVEAIGTQTILNAISTKISEIGDEWPISVNAQVKALNAPPFPNMTPLEEAVFRKQVHGASEENHMKDAVSIPFAGDIWLVRNNRHTCSCTRGSMQHEESAWCRNQPVAREIEFKDQMPYELHVDMGKLGACVGGDATTEAECVLKGKKWKVNYPGSCGRQHFDYNRGVCRATRDGTFVLHGYDDGVSIPLDCTATDVEPNLGETEAQLLGRRAAVSLRTMDELCRNTLVDSFATRSGAVRHCEKHGCSGILHDRNTSPAMFRDKWSSVLGVMDGEHPMGLQSRSGVDAYKVSTINREAAGQGVAIPLCGFCDVEGLPAAALPGKTQCCRCGGGKARRFFNVPTHLMTNPLIPYAPIRSVHPVNGGGGYRKGDVLTLRSNGVPDAKGGKVRVVRVHAYEGSSMPRGNSGTCAEKCATLSTVCASKECAKGDQCLCGKPGDPRHTGAVEEVEIVERGTDYESGAPLYHVTGGSGSGAAFRVKTVDLDGGLLGNDAVGMAAFSAVASVVMGVSTLVLASVAFALSKQRPLVGKIVYGVAGVVGLAAVGWAIVGGGKGSGKGGESRKRVKSAEVCAEDQTIDANTGGCMDSESLMARTMLRRAGFLRK